MRGAVQYFKACILTCDFPIFLTPGNHDNYWDVGDKFTDYRNYLNPPLLLENEQESIEYRDDYSFDYGDYHFIIFNGGDANGITWLTEGLTDTQLNWMKNDQQNAYDQGKIASFIFTHTPSAPDCAWEIRGKKAPLRQEWLGLEYRDHSHSPSDSADNDQAFVSWLNGNSAGYENSGLAIEAVFAGHTHENHMLKDVTVSNMVNLNLAEISSLNYPEAYFDDISKPTLYYDDSTAYHIETAAAHRGD